MVADLFRVSAASPPPSTRLKVDGWALVGDHVQHNAYFIGFPEGVPDTEEFWIDRLHAAVLTGGGTATDEQLRAAALAGRVNLLDLPEYGTYQHTYAELLAVHDDLIAAAADRVTLLSLGDTAEVETQRLYLALAGSTTPHGEADLAILSELTVACLDGAQPAGIPVRENRAVLNGVRLVLGRPLVAVDSTTDVLRLACQVSGGDVSLAAPTRFRAFPRRERRLLLAAAPATGGPGGARHRTATVRQGHRGRLPGAAARLPGHGRRRTAALLHLLAADCTPYLPGHPSFNRVEENTFTTADRVRALTERRYLTIAYLIDLWRAKTEVAMWDGRPPDEPVTFLGLDAPEGLPEDSEIYTLDRLGELIPE